MSGVSRCGGSLSSVQRASVRAARALARPRLVLALPALLALLLYLPTLTYDFVWDDHSFLVSNDSIRSLGEVSRFVTDESTASVHHDSPGIYRPLRNLLWAIEYAAWGLSSAGFHLGSIVLHASNVLLLGWLALILLGRGGGASTPVLWGSFAAASFFALHPLATEAVCWIKANDDLLVTLFLLLGATRAAAWGQRLAGLGPGERAPGRELARVSGLLLLLQLGALGSKEPGVVFPGLVLLAAWAAYERNRSPGDPGFFRRRSAWWLAGAGLLLDLGYLWLRFAVLGEVAQVAVPLARGAALFWTQIRAVGRGLLLLVWPRSLLADYSGYPVSSGPDPAGLVALGTLVVLAGAALLLARRGRAHLCVLAIGWWLLALLPVSNLVPTMQFLAERFLYPGLAGAGLAVGAGVDWLVRRWARRQQGFSHRWLLGAALAAPLCLLGVRAALRVPVWQGSVPLFESVVAAAPGNVRGVQNWVRALFNSGRYREAVEALERLRELSPAHPTLVDLAVDARILAAVQDQLPRLLEHVEDHPEDSEARLELGRLALRARYVVTARRMFEEVREGRPHDWRPEAGLAVAAALENRAEEGRAHLERARALAAQAGVLREDGAPLARWERWMRRALLAAELAGAPWLERPGSPWP